VAFAAREVINTWPEFPGEAPPPGDFAASVLAHLASRGAEFTSTLSASLGVPPSRVRRALDELVRLGRVTNDRFDPLRPGSRALAEDLAQTGAAIGEAPPAGRGGRPRLGGLRRRAAGTAAEGRWSVLGDPAEEVPTEDRLLAWVEALLDRHGVLCRETVTADPWAPAWRDLLPVLDRAEMRGELRRGYFVEGLSGIQYALTETVEELSRLAASIGGSPAPAVLLAAPDPANLYGSGAPLDIPLLEGGTARLTRHRGNALVQVAGRPVLIIEAYGRRLTGLNSSSEEELRAAVALLPTLAGPKRRVLKVESFNTAATLASPAATWLAEVGFVRDPPGMAYYAGWS